jgi:hypothetical protein
MDGSQIYVDGQPPRAARVRLMPFSAALVLMRSGALIARACWPMGQWLRVCQAEETDTVSQPFLMLDRPSPPEAYPGGERVPWSPTHEDLLADDWRVVE